MNNSGVTRIQRGQAITFRLPSDTPDHIIRQLQEMKEKERRNFSSRIAEMVLEGVNHSLSKEKEMITIPLPKSLTKEQRNWLRHSHSEALLGSIVHQLLADPLRAASILATLNSNSIDIDEALYLQEYTDNKISKPEAVQEEAAEDTSVIPERDPEPEEDEDDLASFDWEMARQEADSEEEEPPPEDKDSLLGGFLAHMNK
ncbi:hypothetical protein D3H55_15165 [Bacillus salacetis]|uniref:Uncharacterized protein n=1 Tax=Bacillus salacetis TaxID=2315464 RepID=A0A3A1QUV3_9BACI|nr:hypothetical protein [Bacillus salacetis]RIW31628.1 hypothetical protein D3H55_15165 [Bacillus salacetis]